MNNTAIDFVLSTLNNAEYWLELEAQTPEPLDRTLNIPTVIADLRGAARYVMKAEDNAIAAALLMMTAVYLKQMIELKGNDGFIGEMVNDLHCLIHEIKTTKYAGLFAETDEGPFNF